MATLDLSITICSWNTQADLRECLRCLELAQREAEFEVLVVDNNSADGSPDMVEREFPWVRLFRQYTNLGFTGGHNFLFPHCLGRHILLMNSDAFAQPGAIKEVLASSQRFPEAGIIGPKLLNPDGSLQYSCRRFPDPIAALFRNTFLGRLFPKNKWVRAYLLEDWDHSSAREVDWVSGAVLLITEQVRDCLGGFDPQFYMFCEDVDLCKRCWDAGFDVVYDPIAVFVHKIGSSTNKAPNRMIFRFHKSMYLYYKKHRLSRMNPVTRPFVALAAMSVLTLRAGLFIIKNKLDEIKRRWLR